MQITAVDILLQHEAVKSRQQLVCRIATVCQQWRAAVQQSQTHALNITLELAEHSAETRLEPTLEYYVHVDVQKLASLAEWIPKYASLVHSINIRQHASWGSLLRANYASKTASLLARSLQAAAAVVSGAGAAQQQQQLRLASYCSDVIVSKALLCALPGASLTRLELKHCDHADLAAALPQVTNLETLRTMATSTRDNLVVYTVDFPTSQLPTSLQKLELHYSWCSGAEQLINLAHLTRLTSLVIDMDGYVRVGSTLPAQLSDLTVFIRGARLPEDNNSTLHPLNIGACQHLQQLRIKEQTTTELVQLASLPHLQVVELSYEHPYGSELVLAAAPVWPLMPRLHSLIINGVAGLQPGLCHFSSQSTSEMARHLACVSGLTRLLLSIEVGGELGGGNQPPATVCEHVARLRSLRELELVVSAARLSECLVADDAHHLSALTNLTKLTFDMSLFSSSAALLAIGKLTNLNTLTLLRLPSAEQHFGSDMLSGLKQLTKLVGFEDCDATVLADIMAAPSV